MVNEVKSFVSMFLSQDKFYWYLGFNLFFLKKISHRSSASRSSRTFTLKWPYLGEYSNCWQDTMLQAGILPLLPSVHFYYHTAVIFSCFSFVFGHFLRTSTTKSKVQRLQAKEPKQWWKAQKCTDVIRCNKRHHIMNTVTLNVCIFQYVGSNGWNKRNGEKKRPFHAF